MPDPRGPRIDAFLAAHGWGSAARHALAGDASNRRYLRLKQPDGTRAVLMDAPPERGEDVRPFTAIARHLSALGLSAPAILAEDTQTGLLLLEDLGDALYARVLERDPAQEPLLYRTATDLLVELHRHAPPADLAPYAPPLMADLAALALDWYRHGATGENDIALRARFCAEIETHLSALPETDSVLIQRDYHAENLLWLPDRAGVARVGLLDFQDAMRGHPAYDLVSLLQDARRDVTPATTRAMLDHYIAATGADADAFTTAFHWLGAQRNLRILGVFARLSLRDGKPHYVALIPRVWAHLQTDLRHPALAPLAALVAEALPPPTPAHLARLTPGHAA
jgi:aminoglycoside/choline kinase family phosphotransferase